MFLAACAGDGDPGHGAPGPDCPSGFHETFAAWGEAGFSGSITVSTAGEFDCRAAFGEADRSDGTPNTPDTVYSIGSVSKAFTAAAVAGLVNDGRVALADRAGDAVPGLHGAAADATIEQLLLHTSGLSGSHGADHEPLSRSEAIAAISTMEPAFAPGTHHQYSNSGYTLLAAVIEEAAETSFREYLTKQILPVPDGGVAGGFWDGEPAAAGPRAVGYQEAGATSVMGGFAGPHWSLQGNGDLAMTMPDLAAWTHALFTGQIIAPEAVDLLDGDALINDASETPGWVAHAGSEYGRPFLTSSGGGGDIGHDVAVAWVPHGERVVAIASNTPVITAGELLQAIGPALMTEEQLPLPDQPAADVDPAELAEVAGRYELASGGSYEVAVRAGGLTITAYGTDAVAALFPRPADVEPVVVAAHEKAVAALLAGETEQGRDERALLESDLGEITAVNVAGTVVDEGELRTYVAVSTNEETIMLWYALDEYGAIAGAEGPVDAPSLPVVPLGGGRFRPADPAGSRGGVTVEFDGSHLAASGPAGTTVAVAD